MAKTWNATEKGPAVWLDGGNSIVTQTAQDLQADRLVVEVMDSIPYKATNLGMKDLPPFYGPFHDLFEARRWPFVSANLRFHDSGERAFPAWRILEVPSPDAAGAPLRVGVVGVADAAAGEIGTGPAGRTLVVTDPAEELSRVLPELRPQCDVLVVLAAGSMSSYPDVLPKDGPRPDALVISASEPIWPDAVKTLDGMLVVMGGDRGRELIHLTVFRKPEGGYRLAADKLTLLTETMPEDPATRDRVETLTTDLNEQARALFAGASVEPVPVAPFVGAVQCAGCHKAAYETWTKSAHGQAFQTLVHEKRDFTRNCIMCHVTGFENADGGGFRNAVATPGMKDVQCEACHGPAEAHLKDPSAPYGKVETPDRCAGCHNKERSPQFDYATYWAKISH